MRFNGRLALPVLVGVAALLGASLVMTSRPSFCQSCHEMKEDYRAWQASAHKDVSCVSCHIKPGALNFAQHKVAALKEVAAHLTGGFEAPINKGSALSEELPQANCVSCHNSPGGASNGRVLFAHESHKAAGLACAYCHNRTAHPGIMGYESRITMPLCTECHIKEGAPVTCATCHPPGFKLMPDSHAKESWSKVHGRGDITGCDYCHFKPERFCTGCHGLDMPHPKGWPTSHGKNDPRLNRCSKCHEENFCARCHEEE